MGRTTVKNVRLSIDLLVYEPTMTFSNNCTSNIMPLVFVAFNTSVFKCPPFWNVWRCAVTVLSLTLCCHPMVNFIYFGAEFLLKKYLHDRWIGKYSQTKLINVCPDPRNHSESMSRKLGDTLTILLYRTSIWLLFNMNEMSKCAPSTLSWRFKMYKNCINFKLLCLMEV